MCFVFCVPDSKIIMIPKTGQLRIANVDENDLRHSYTCRIVNKLTGFTQESSTCGRIYFGKRIRRVTLASRPPPSGRFGCKNVKKVSPNTFFRASTGRSPGRKRKADGEERVREGKAEGRNGSER